MKLKVAYAIDLLESLENQLFMLEDIQSIIIKVDWLKIG